MPRSDVAMTNNEALTLRPGDRIRPRPHPGSGIPPTLIVARVTVTGEGLVIVTTTGVHVAPWEVERVDPRRGWPTR